MALATIPLAFIGNLFAVIFAYIIGGICGIGVMIQLAYESCFAVPRRVRDVKPKILDQLDFEHGFLRVPTYHGFKNESEPLRDSEIRLHYVAAGEPGRPLMLFIHGFPDLWFGWRHQLQHFRSHFRVVAIDNRGYGESDKPTDRRAYTLPLLVRDVRSVIQQMGYEKCILVGHDWGGLISWTFAAVFPEMVDLLIVMNCPHPLAFSRMPFGDLIRQFFKSWYIFFFQLPYLPERMFLSNDLYRVEAMLTQPPLCRTPSAVTPKKWKYTSIIWGKTVLCGRSSITTAT
ncbi:epoxide hydrolase 4-like [Paramacrobiotus metropolitanus]|uniref:epoxide hydrolase 4-like n=1 Tax=Paramacrobiotus metropolitanus TaxID=2943436 RepID=UPI002445B451|nr:epoxide hydrolase 4-like [Paramacrobiotus metropolitanus]